VQWAARASVLVPHVARQLVPLGQLRVAPGTLLRSFISMLLAYNFLFFFRDLHDTIFMSSFQSHVGVSADSHDARQHCFNLCFIECVLITGQPHHGGRAVVSGNILRRKACGLEPALENREESSRRKTGTAAMSQTYLAIDELSSSKRVCRGHLSDLSSNPSKFVPFKCRTAYSALQATTHSHHEL